MSPPLSPQLINPLGDIIFVFLIGLMLKGWKLIGFYSCTQNKYGQEELKHGK